MTILTDLPEDILTIIFSFSDAKSFLALCQTCKDLYQYRQDPAFWRTITSSTFRLPISPLLKADGARWYWLYKRLRTQTKLYTWGQGLKGNLGPGRGVGPARFLRGQMQRPMIRHPVPANPTVTFQRTNSTWPTEAHVPEEVGVMADMQCGGWSTSILSSEGRIYTVGVIDSSDGVVVGESAEQFVRLEYLTQSTSAIRQFSSGRQHILALTDDGEILSWDRVNAKGLKVFSQHGRDFGGRANRVVAGWGESSAYIPETGIVYWKPIVNDQQDDMLDGRHVKEKIVPGTARHIASDEQEFDIVTHVILESWIVWLRSDGKLFACNLHVNDESQAQPSFPPFEVPGYTSSIRFLRDVQGQFRKFAVFTETGEVLAGNTDYLQLCLEKARAHPSVDDPTIIAPPTEWTGLDDLIRSRPQDVPALQHNQVISLAFGDHHYHALHLNGKITSYGNDPQSCGALGLGDLQSGGRFRGLTSDGGWRPDAKLLSQAERRGRQIWFEPEKKDWLRYMEETLKSRRLGETIDARGHRRPAVGSWEDPNTEKQFMFSEWVEQEGRHWEAGPLQGSDLTGSAKKTTEREQDFHLGSYFALAISAAGWHSGALVLVDEEKAEAARDKWITKTPGNDDQDEHQSKLRQMPGHFETGPTGPEEVYVWKLDGFPKVKLPDGFEMPGEGRPRPWRGGVPSMSELGLRGST